MFLENHQQRLDKCIPTHVVWTEHAVCGLQDLTWEQVTLYAPKFIQTLLVLLFVWFLGFAKFISGNSLGGMAVLCSGKIHLWIFGLIFLMGLQRQQWPEGTPVTFQVSCYCSFLWRLAWLVSKHANWSRVVSIIFSFGNERLVIFVQVPTKELWELPFKVKSMKPTWNLFWN